MALLSEALQKTSNVLSRLACSFPIVSKGAGAGDNRVDSFALN